MNRSLKRESGKQNHANVERGKRNAEHRLRAFSLLETIGVLAVLAILATLLVPAFIRQMDKAAGDQESAALMSFGGALRQSIMRNRYIPSDADWASTVATELGVDVASVTNSPRRQPRFFLIDEGLRISGGGLPYRQTNSIGATGAPNARVMLVSSISRPLPASIVSGVMSSNDFKSLWGWNDATNTLPTTSFVWTGWPSSEDLRVQRVDLSPLFVPLVLSRYPPDTPRYSIDSTDWSWAIPVTNRLNTLPPWPGYFIQNSVLTLYTADSAIDSQQILIRNSAFVYYTNRWYGSVSGAAFVAGLDIAAVVDQYMAAYPNARAQYGTDQQRRVVQAMMDYMDAYSRWAAEGFPYVPNIPPPYLVSAQAAMKTAVQGQYQHNSYNPDEVPCQ